jgi:hypothetical protein
MKDFKSLSLLNSIAFLSIILILISNATYSQDINGKLGTGGQFIIRDTTNTFLTLSQSTGNLSLNRSMILPSTSAGSQLGTVFKGTDRFIHTYHGSGTTGNNTFLGINSGNFSISGSGTQGSYNTAVGYSSLTSLTTGFNNSAFGYQSLYSNTAGYSNSAFGNQSLLNNTTGNQNSAFGNMSLYSNTTGYSNSAFGYGSLYNNTTGYYNSAFGYQSLYGTTGSYNTALGHQAGYNITTGSNNIAIGYNAQVPTGTASNQIRLGNTSITYAGIQVAWTVTSDRRYKDNITPIGLGLGFISKLNPVSYVRKNDEKGRTEYGLIAQEVEEVLKSEGIENHAMLKVTDEGMYELRYNDLLAPIIKAIQELKMKNEELQAENASLKSQIVDMNDLKEKVAYMEKVLNELQKNQNNLKEIKLGER